MRKAIKWSENLHKQQKKVNFAYYKPSKSKTSMKRFLSLLTLALAFSISANAQTTYFNGGHQDAPLGFVLGYVNKYWSTDMNGSTIKENLWGQEDKRLHGFQMGVTYSPCLPFGLGIDTGLFFEAYISDSEVVHEAGYDNFTESNLYIPIHGMYRIPFNRDCSLSLYGGIGMNIVLSGEYNIESYYTGYDWLGGRPYGYHETFPAAYQAYDEGEWPKSFNLQWEFGAKFRIKNFMIGAGYAIGATNHKFYRKESGDGWYKTRQNKLNISVGYVVDLK